MIENQIKLCRRLKKDTPVLQRRTKTQSTKPITLQRRKKPDVFYCAKRSIKNRLPFPIECNWVGDMYECCRKCDKKVNYSFWKRGTYDKIKQELENKTYRADSTEETKIRTFIEQEEEGR